MLSNDGRLKTGKWISLEKQPQFLPNSDNPCLEKQHEFRPNSDNPYLKKQHGFRPNSKKPCLEKQPEFPSNSKKQRLEKQLEFLPISNRPRGSFPAPRVQLSHKRIARAPKKEGIQCAGIALSSWNEKSLSEQGPEYELVDALGCIGLVGPTIYHFNFIARPKNGSEAEKMLFFAEVEYSEDFTKDGEDGALCCNVCCILGSSDTVTGLCGCLICKLHPSLVQHPKDGEFTKGSADARAKLMAKHRHFS